MRDRLIACLRVGCSLMALGVFGGTAVAADFRAGAAVRVITPEPLLPVSGGMGPAHPVSEKRGDLTARVLVVADGDTTVGIVGIDVLGFPAVLGDKVRALVPRLPPDHLLIAATHTHSAPDCYAFPDGKGGHTGNLAWMEEVVRRTAEAVNEALDGLRPASLRVATAEAQGKIAFNFYAPDLYDRRMGVIQAVGSDGKPIATLVNYAIHPEVLGNKRGILSPDCIGPMCTRIEASGGGVAVFLNGAQGGMVTADNRDLDAPADPLRGSWKEIGTWEECERIGHTMADEALRIVAGAETAPGRGGNVARRPLPGRVGRPVGRRHALPPGIRPRRGDAHDHRHARDGRHGKGADSYDPGGGAPQHRRLPEA